MEADHPRSMFVDIGRRFLFLLGVLLISFLLVSPPAPARTTPGPVRSAGSTSPLISFDFTAGDEGWLLGDPIFSAPTYSASDGNPGGYIADASGTGVGLQSPPLSPSDQRAAFGGTLAIDYRFEDTGFNQLAVELVSNSGNGMSGTFGAEDDLQVWLHDYFPLGSGNGNAWFSTGNQGYMDDDEIRAILNDLRLIKVYGGSTGRVDIDNVTLNPPQHFGASLSIAERDGTFKGKLSKTSPDCGYRRSFAILRKRAGRDPKVGETSPQKKPAYEIHVKAAAGKFYAQARELDLPGQGLICDAAKSKTIVVKKRSSG